MDVWGDNVAITRTSWTSFNEWALPNVDTYGAMGFAIKLDNVLHKITIENILCRIEIFHPVKI